MTQSNMIKELTVKELINSEDTRYIIPIYQRNYDWGAEEIEMLISDLKDFIDDNRSLGNNIEDHSFDNSIKKYYLGTLIVYERNNSANSIKEDNKTESGKITTFEVIDGQQRLTTLTLLYLYLSKDDDAEAPNTQNDAKNMQSISIEFENRKSAQQAVLSIKQYQEDRTQFEGNTIYTGYKIIENVISSSQDTDNKYRDKKELKKQLKEILEKNVVIYRVKLPEGTDLNHYFEIMNSRGEQLEKHEIIKALLMSKLDQRDQKIFANIWDACSNFENHIQSSLKDLFKDRLSPALRFSKNNPTGLFDENLQYLNNEFNLFSDEVYNIEKEHYDTQNGSVQDQSSNKLFDILKNPDIYASNSKSEDEKKTKTAKYNKNVIEFPNFLQIALSIFLYSQRNSSKCNSNSTDDIDHDNINLDDKKIIPFFERLYTEKNKDEVKKDIKEFAQTLFKIRYLFDSYIIKRVDNKSDKSNKNSVEYNWKIQSYKYENSNESLISTFSRDERARLIWLQSMFHVSFPAKNYKYWLFSALYYLNDNYKYETNNNQTIDLERFTKHLDLLARLFMYGDGDYKNRATSLIKIIGESENIEIKLNFINKKMINSDNLLYPTITVYTLNYLDYLLLKLEEDNFNKILKPIYYEEYKKHVDNFMFTIRSSKEHFYPQNPEIKQIVEPKILDSIGNLCLITASRNSELNNSLPKAKIEKLSEDFNDKSLQSIKLYFLIKLFENTDNNIETSKDVIKKLKFFMNKIIIKDIEMLPINNNQYSEALQALTRETLWEQPIMRDDRYHLKRHPQAGAYIEGSDLRDKKFLVRFKSTDEQINYDSIEALIHDGWVID